jgi:hypothetical protein
MDGEENIENPSPGGEMEHQNDDDHQDLQDNIDMEGSHEGGDDSNNAGEEGGEEDENQEDGEGGAQDDDEEVKEGDGSPVSKKSRSVKKKQSMKTAAQTEAEKSKDLAKEPRKLK